MQIPKRKKKIKIILGFQTREYEKYTIYGNSGSEQEERSGILLSLLKIRLMNLKSLKSSLR